MATQHQHHIDEEDPDILALREVALSSLISKEKKRVHNEGNHINQTFQHEHHHPSNLNHMHDHPLNVNGGAMNYGGHRPSFHNQPTPVRQQMYNPVFHHQPMLPRPSFVPHRPAFQSRPPMMPIIQPHLNPNFISQPHHHPPRFVATGPSELLPMHVTMPLEQDEDMPLMPDTNGTFEPTPPSRLSPRSAKFVASNNEAMRRQSRRSFSRSRSRSPYTYRYNSRSRSRSPHYKAQISHIVRKRTRSKSPAKYVRKSRSPRRRTRTPDTRVSPKYSVDNDRNKRARPFKHNGNNVNNRDRYTKPENDYKNQDRKATRTSPRNDKDKIDGGSGDDKNNDKTSLPTAKVTEAKVKREKTEQELEDELLASTDSEASVKDAEDDDLKMTLDKEDLDFLDDDEEESENEGRFKSKASSSTSNQHKRPAASSSGFKPSYPARKFDKSKNYDKNYPRNDYKRSKYSDKDDSKRERKVSRSPIDSSQRGKDEKRYVSPIRKHKKSPEARKSPEPVRKPTKEPVQSSKVIVINSKEKQNDLKDESKKLKAVKPMFKATFKSVDEPAEEKKKEEEPKKEERKRLVRGPVASKVESAKTEKPSKEGRNRSFTKTIEVEGKRPAIMKRLGGYIKDPAQKAAKAWAKEQAP